MKGKLAVYMVLGTIISIFALYFAFKNVPFSALLNYINSINYLWTILGAGAAIVSLILRAIRWQIIVGALSVIRFWEAFHPLSIAFMINNVFPGRTGEIARPAILKIRSRVSFTSGLATVAAERLIDLVFLVILFITISYTIDLTSGKDFYFSGYHVNGKQLLTIFKGFVLLSIFLFTIMVTLSFQITRKLGINLIYKIPALFWGTSLSFKEKISQKLCVPLVLLTENLASGFSLVRAPKRIYIILVITGMIWAIQAWSFYLVALGCPGLRLSFPEITAVMILICFSIILPSVPGYWGLWEAGGLFALSLFGIPHQEALGYTLINHVVQIFPVTIIGLVSAWTTGINVGKISKATNRMEVKKIYS